MTPKLINLLRHIPEEKLKAFGKHLRSKDCSSMESVKKLFKLLETKHFEMPDRKVIDHYLGKGFALPVASTRLKKDLINISSTLNTNPN